MSDKNNNATEIMDDLTAKARIAAKALSITTSDIKQKALIAAASALRTSETDILAANALDMQAGANKGLSDAMLDRLKLDSDRIAGIAKGLDDIAALPDPVGQIMDAWDRPNGLKIERVRTPLGVIGVIYESRPNVTADAAALCLKAGNAVILRGGSESLHSSQAILKAMQAGFRSVGLTENAAQMVPTSDRTVVGAMLTATGKIDVIVPRGGRSLVDRVQSEARVPVFAHLEGINHIYVDAGADPVKATEVVLNAKMRRTGICGAAETLLVHQGEKELLKQITDVLITAGCTIKGGTTVCAAVPQAEIATAKDWQTEYLDAIISVNIVKDFDQALEHISDYSSGHTDCIITENTANATRFMAEVDSAIVMHNCSTQFADGGEFGMGAEIGIATGRIHARGPVGCEQLTTFKYRVHGSGQTRP